MSSQWKTILVGASGIVMAAGQASGRDNQPITTQRVMTSPAAPSPADPRRAVRPKKKEVQDQGLLSVLAGQQEKDGRSKGNALDAGLQDAIQGLAFVKKNARYELLERSKDDLSPTRRGATPVESESDSLEPRRDRRYGDDVTRWSGPREIDLRSDPLPGGPRPTYGADEVKRQIRAHKDQIQYCYGRELERQSTFSGQLVFACEVGPDGQVTSTEVVVDTLRSEPLRECLERRVRTWTFPPPKSGQPTLARIPILY